MSSGTMLLCKRGVVSKTSHLFLCANTTFRFQYSTFLSVFQKWPTPKCSMYLIFGCFRLHSDFISWHSYFIIGTSVCYLNLTFIDSPTRVYIHLFSIKCFDQLHRLLTKETTGDPWDHALVFTQDSWSINICCLFARFLVYWCRVWHSQQ